MLAVKVSGLDEFARKIEKLAETPQAVINAVNYAAADTLPMMEAAVEGQANRSFNNGQGPATGSKEVQRQVERTEMNQPIGYRGQQVLEYIEAVVGRDGIAPTYTMIAEQFDMERADVCQVVKRLESRGLLRRRQATRRQSIGWHKPVIVLCSARS